MVDVQKLWTLATFVPKQCVHRGAYARLARFDCTGSDKTFARRPLFPNDILR